MKFTKRKLVLFLTFFVIIILLGQFNVTGLINLKNNLTSFDKIELSSHLPIHINGNDEFTSDNGVVSGDGSVNDPFVIECWNIQANMTNDGIRIENTNKYFIVQSCHIFYIDGIIAMYKNSDDKTPYFKNEEEKPYPIGIFLNNVSNGVVKRCEINGTIQAMCLNNSNSNVVTNCYLYKNMCGIGVKLNSYNNIVCNCCSRNYNCGVCLYQNVTNNIINNCTSSALHSIFAPRLIWTGYYIQDSKYNVVVNSSSYLLGIRILKLKDRGFIIINSCNNSINNFLSHGLPRALVVFNSANNSITNSKIYNNIIGFYADIKSKNNFFEDNCFIKNMVNAFDISKDNIWDDNYWDDWIGLKITRMQHRPYNVPGRLFYNYDLHPKLFPQ
jgi:hypothetical protein